MKNRWITIALVIVILIILVSFTTEFTGMFKRWFGEEDFEPVDYEDTPIPPGSLDPEFDSAPYVARLIEVLRFLWDSSPRCDAYRRLLELSDPEFVIVCNDYKNQVGRTLRSDMDAQIYDGCNVFYNRYGVQVRERMDQLGVIG